MHNTLCNIEVYISVSSSIYNILQIAVGKRHCVFVDLLYSLLVIVRQSMISPRLFYLNSLMQRRCLPYYIYTIYTNLICNQHP